MRITRIKALKQREEEVNKAKIQLHKPSLEENRKARANSDTQCRNMGQTQVRSSIGIVIESSGT